MMTITLRIALILVSVATFLQMMRKIRKCNILDCPGLGAGSVQRVSAGSGFYCPLSWNLFYR